MQCTDPIRITKNLDVKDYPDGLSVPCGKCLSCRIKKRSEWTTRLIHEHAYWQDAMFVTLTYNEETIPYSPNTGYTTVKKEALQKFFKRLRKNCNRKIKHFSVGEYGDEFDRAHYHSIIFGLNYLNEEDRKYVKYSWQNCDWDNHNINTNAFGSVTGHSIRYVAQYIDKLFTGSMAEAEYCEKDREPVFRLVSNGIGLKFALNNQEQLKKNKYTTINGVPVSLPRYYINKLNIDIDEVKENRIIRERDVVKLYTDIDGLSYDEAYRLLSARENVVLNESIKKARLQSDKNINDHMVYNKNKSSSIF